MILRFAPRVSLPLLINRNRFASGLCAAAVAILSLAGLAPQALAQGQYVYRTMAGIGTQPGNLDGTGGSVAPATQFDHPFGLALNSSGTLYVSDNGNSLIRQVTSAGVVTTLAGTLGTSGENNGTTLDPKVTFNLPQGMVTDSAGNIYVADYAGATIRKITPAGVVTTLAGTANSAGFVNGTGTAAKFNAPSSLAIDASGNLYVADSGNQLIRKVTSTGEVTTLAGTAGTVGYVDGKGTAAAFRNPRGVACDSSGNVYVADTGNNTIRKITADGTVTTFAGTQATFGSTDGTGSAARFSFPNGLAVDKSGNIYVADELNATIRKITPDAVVTTLAGLPAGEGRVDGQGSAARFNHPTAVAVDGNGTLYVADYGNSLIRKVSATGLVTTLVGTGGVTGYLDGSGYLLNPTLFQNPTHPVVDGAGTVYLTDTGNNSIRKITADGTVSLFVGSAALNVPAGLARDSAGNLYVADSGNHLIRKVAPDGSVTILAGLLKTRGSTDGGTDVALFNSPSGVAIDGAGNVYVADYSNHTIRKIAAGGGVTTLAGSAGQSGSADGSGSSARFEYPRDLAIDAAGNLFVADSGNHTIRKVTQAGDVTTVAGSAGSTGSADGTGSSARFNGPAGLTVDGGGNIFVVDTNNSTVRLVTPGGAVSTIGGTVGVVGTADGTGAAALFNHPTGIAVDASGTIYIADNGSNTLRAGAVNGGSGGGSGGGGSGGGGSGGGGSGGGGSGGGAYDDGTTGSGVVLHPGGLVIDSAGNLYVCDSAQHCIRKVTVLAVATVFAGQSGSAGSADGTGTNARFSNPTGITIDGSGTLYVTDTGNSTVRKITASGEVTTFAGAAGQTGSTDGTGSAARFNSPQGVAVYSNGDLFVSDTINNTIRKITSAGVVTTFAGTVGVAGDNNGLGTAARFNHPTGMAFDGSGLLLIADTYNNTLRALRVVDLTSTDSSNVTTVLVPASTVVTVAGSAGLAGAYDGQGEYALFNLPQGVATQPTTGVIYVADTGNNSIRLVTGTGLVRTLAGIATASGKRSGPGETALFNQPQAVAASGTNAVLVSDTGNSVLRVVALSSLASYDSTVSTIPLTNGPTGGGGGGGGDGGSGGDGGGGAPSVWFIAALGGLAALRKFVRRDR